MTKYFPSGAVAPYEILTAEPVNAELRALASYVNRLDRENFPPSSITDRELEVSACNEFNVTYIAGPLTYTHDGVKRGWYKIPSLIQTFTSPEGMCRGAFSGSIERYAGSATITSIFSYYRIGIFLDGILVAETDQIWVIEMGLNLSFAVPIIAGTHTVEVGLKGEIPITTKDGVIGENILQVHDSNIWTRIAKR